MIWLELRANNTIFDKGWNFKESVWAPTKKADGANWPFWNLVNDVTKGDLIFHIKENNGIKYFVGYSIAATDGYLTKFTSSKNHIWSYTDEFYKVDLSDFEELNPIIPLNDFFTNYNQELRNYFLENKKLSKAQKKRLFYVIQRDKLQCLNGAYFSEFDSFLASKISDELLEVRKTIKNTAKTDVVVKELEQRIGHQEFSENVKSNFNYKCCYPGCNVEGKGFLISGHITRWADNKDLRGNTDNGLCLCLMHDKAFEKGFFTLDNNYKVILIRNKFENKKWLLDYLEQGENIEIKTRQINPSLEALKNHWIRIGNKT
ncbi:hypothetical protein HKT18_01735 [Flavobacterium sp. IMCC34852]|uniref:HNH nuclease domain-containing protein n=1 Tax=Flavobacterium rivulicola TaxID=2732161 RepID=A0A7Y3R6N5_9FLAO|nr:HNH endonuclease [Flavobacterium sp. IMCC34852]NNT70925.1 hypothetical protein [Flavobacterium sp. IMCC34852]